MVRQDRHVHTVYCDGKDTPARIAQVAYEQGLTVLGFSGHSYTPFDTSYCMSEEATTRYRADIAALKEQYRGKMEILCGVEQDVYSPAPTDGYDFVIASAHYVRCGDTYLPIDESADVLKRGARELFDGDMYALCAAYYAALTRAAAMDEADVIGHFDLVTKFNEPHPLFDETDARYVTAWQTAADMLIAAGKVFEINTGAISRGYRTTPYPSAAIRDYIRARGGRFVLSSDSHSAETLCFDFDTYTDWVK